MKEKNDLDELENDEEWKCSEDDLEKTIFASPRSKKAKLELELKQQKDKNATTSENDTTD